MKTLEDYQKLGQLMGLQLVGTPPLSVKQDANWICIGCGRTKTRCYNKLRYDQRGCRCQGSLALTAERYHETATRLGIKWVANKVPLTVLERTNWQSWDGRFFQASFHQIGYDLLNIPRVYHNFLPKRILDIIESERESLLEHIRQRNAQL